MNIYTFLAALCCTIPTVSLYSTHDMVCKGGREHTPSCMHVVEINEENLPPHLSAQDVYAIYEQTPPNHTAHTKK